MTSKFPFFFKTLMKYVGVPVIFFLLFFLLIFRSRSFLELLSISSPLPLQLKTCKGASKDRSVKMKNGDLKK